jgi:hypothetical protein
MRFSGEQPEGYAENLILSALRLLQDCPSNGIALRKVRVQNILLQNYNSHSNRSSWWSSAT